MWRVDGRGQDYEPESREKSGAEQGQGGRDWTRAGTVGRVKMNWKTFERQNVQSAVTVRLGREREVTPSSPAQVPVGEMGSVRTDMVSVRFSVGVMG